MLTVEELEILADTMGLKWAYDNLPNTEEYFAFLRNVPVGFTTGYTVQEAMNKYWYNYITSRFVNTE